MGSRGLEGESTAVAEVVGSRIRKNIERESSDQTVLIREEAGGGGVGVCVCVAGCAVSFWRVCVCVRESDVCIQLRADSSYANTANFLFYFISGAEICDLR